MELSLRAGFKAIGDFSAVLPSYPSGLASAPKSLQEGIRGMVANPIMGGWVRVSPEAFADENWSEECQGVTFDGQRFITSSNGSAVVAGDVLGVTIGNPGYFFNQSPKALYRFRPTQYSFRDGDIQETFHLGGHPEDHLGDIDYFDGWIYCAIEPHQGGPPRVLRVSAQGPLGQWSNAVPIHGVAASGQSGFPWCAVNPFNGLLYSSPFYDSGGDKVFAYDRDTGDWAGEQRTIRLTRPAYRIQGGCFSPRGHLYLASDRAESVSSGETVTFPAGDVHLVGVGGETDPPRRRTFILCYSAFNGQYLGRTFVDTFENNQELEGICYAPMAVGGHPAQVHVVLLENRTLAKDNAFIKPYAGPDPDTA